MIIVKSPFRISFIGGGTDFYDFFHNHGGEVISTTIDKYVYITVTEKFDNKIHVRYSKTECVDTAKDIKHGLFRNALDIAGIDSGIEMVSISDIPSLGSGLGSSGAFSVGLLHALYAFKGCNLSPRELAHKASELEIDMCGSTIGYQDQFASAFGDLNQIRFRPYDNCNPAADPIHVHPLREKANYDKLKWLESATMLFYLGTGHDASSILYKHSVRINENRNILINQRALVEMFRNWLCAKTHTMETAGFLVSKSWEYKKLMTPEATSKEIDAIISGVLKVGACGAKLCGAGGGGFLMVICDPSKQHHVRDALNHLHELKFNFSRCGSSVIYKNGCGV